MEEEEDVMRTHYSHSEVFTVERKWPMVNNVDFSHFTIVTLPLHFEFEVDTQVVL